MGPLVISREIRILKAAADCGVLDQTPVGLAHTCTGGKDQTPKTLGNEDVEGVPRSRTVYLI